MELPHELKALYRHWDDHTRYTPTHRPPRDIFVDPHLYKEMEAFIHERIRIWEQKIAGNPPPYTTDPILAHYRFCNIFRECDKQTIAFHTLLNPLRNDFPRWLLNMFACRMIARLETSTHLGLLSLNAQENKPWQQHLENLPRPRYGNAYVFPISAIQKSAFPTRETFLATYVPSVINTIANTILTWKKKSAYEGLEEILPLFGFDLRFLWTEVLIDVAYQFPHTIDLFSTFPVGPGATPTLNRINPQQRPALLTQKLTHIPLTTGITINGKLLPLSAENWEGICCEFRKYTNLKNGTGRKRLFLSQK